MGHVLFDGTCSLCVTLAHWSASRMGGTATFLSIQEYARSHGEKEGPVLGEKGENDTAQLVVLDDERRVYRGKDAWAWLLVRHPQLREIAWIAQKLDLTDRVASRFEWGGKWLRRLCRTCP